MITSRSQTLLYAAVLVCAGCASDSAPPGMNAGPASQAGMSAMLAPVGGSAGLAAASGSKAPAPAGTAAVAGRGAQAGTSAAGMSATPPDDADGGMTPPPVTTPPAAGPVLPSVSDPAQPGPFGAEVVATAPGLDTHKLYVPAKLGENGVKHPIIVWTNGAGGSTNFYENLLRHFASHGFFVVADKMSGGNHNPEIVEQKAGIEWAIAEAARAGGTYAGKIDAARLAVAGHSLGSISSFASAAHPAVKASIHWSAGLTGNPVNAEEAWLQGLHAPAAFFCGGGEPRALPRCSGDFENAPASVPIFYGTVAGVGHTDVYGEPNAGQWGRAGVAWFRFTLAGDESFRSWFKAPMCTLCSNPWTGMSRGI
jgi:Chlorophyllase enzyme